MTEANALIEALARRLFPRDPNFRYFECRTCRRSFLWTTERMGDGRYASAVLVPTGRGSRSGKPSAWKTREEVHHSTRAAAKARALRFYERHLQDERPEIGDRVQRVRGRRQGVVADPGSGAHPDALVGVLWDGASTVEAVRPDEVRKVRG